MSVAGPKISAAVDQLPDWVGLGSPGPGKPMTARVERMAVRVRHAVRAVASDISITDAEFCALYGPRLSGLGFQLKEGEAQLRAGWAITAQWLIGYGNRALDAGATLAEAEAWFQADTTGLPRVAPAASVPQLSEIADPEEVLALLPYLLDPLAPATRRCVLKNEDLLADRNARKKAGIYYTPADLARYMTVRALSSQASNCFDPACGSGVFLRSARLAQPDVQTFGCDTDPLAVELCAFVLTAAAPENAWHGWHQRRCALATCDSLLLRPGTELSDFEWQRRKRSAEQIQQALAEGLDPGPAGDTEVSRWLGTIFPDLRDGADSLVANPPYAPLGDHPRLDELSELYTCFDGGARPAMNTFGPFVEQGWRLTDARHGRFAIVVPLSLGFGQRNEIRRLRQAMSTQPGRWRFCFFDRTPDALFGDDVKTRNAIAEYSAEAPRGIETTALLRWTSRTRSKFFSSIQHQPVEEDITKGIPKLGSAGEARIYRALYQRGQRLRGCLGAVGKCRADSSDAASASRLYVAPTAYNWLNCARSLDPWQGEVGLATSEFLWLDFGDATTASAGYALLVSRVIYWLWRVVGDGFHVSAGFLKGLPFDLKRMPDARRATLAEIGDQLWLDLKREPLESVNKGRRSLAFPASRRRDVLDTLDDLVLRGPILRPAAEEFDLASWYESVVTVDPTDRRRLRLVRQAAGPAC